MIRFCFLLVIALCSFVSAQEESTVPIITAADMQALYEAEETFVLLDLQTSLERQEYGYPPESICIPFKFQDPVTKEWSENESFLSRVKDRFKPTDRIILLCGQGIRSAEAAQILAKEGYENISIFENGVHGRETDDGELLPGWVEFDLPFVQGFMN